MNNKRVVVYSTPVCGSCKVLKTWLDKKGVVYETKDASNPAVAEVLIAGGWTSLPVTIVDDEIVVMGVDTAKLTEVLEL